MIARDDFQITGTDPAEWSVRFAQMVAENSSYDPSQFQRSRKAVRPCSDAVELPPSACQTAIAEEMAMLQGITSYQRLKEHFKSNRAIVLQEHQIPENIFSCLTDRDVEDVHAQWILRNYIPPKPEDPKFEEMVALNTHGNGNCFYHAASRLLFGVQYREMEVRYRIVREAVMNESLYQDDSYLLLGHIFKGDFESAGPCSFLAILLQYADLSAICFSEQQVKRRFQQHVMNSLRPGQEASLFEVYMLCNIMRRPVRVLFPQLATEPSRVAANIIRDHNRTIWPEIQTIRQYEPVNILWTVTGAHDHTPNHFVPVVL